MPRLAGEVHRVGDALDGDRRLGAGIAHQVVAGGLLGVEHQPRVRVLVRRVHAVDGVLRLAAVREVDRDLVATVISSWRIWYNTRQ